MILVYISFQISDQGIPVLEHSVGLNTRGRIDSDGTCKNILKQALNFAKSYVAARDNLSSRFDCFTLKLYK